MVTGEMSSGNLRRERAPTQPHDPSAVLCHVQDFQTTGVEALRREDLRKVLATLPKISKTVRSMWPMPSIPAAPSRLTIAGSSAASTNWPCSANASTKAHRRHLRTQRRPADDKSAITSVHGLAASANPSWRLPTPCLCRTLSRRRFLVPCDGRADLRLAMLALDEIFRDQISDEQRKTLDLHFAPSATAYRNACANWVAFSSCSTTSPTRVAQSGAD